MTDLEILTDEFCKLWNTLKARHMDLTIHQVAIESLLKKHPELPDPVNALLADSKQIPALHESMNQKYASILGPLLQRFSAALPATVRKHLSSLEDLENL